MGLDLFCSDPLRAPALSSQLTSTPQKGVQAMVPLEGLVTLMLSKESGDKEEAPWEPSEASIQN